MATRAAISKCVLTNIEFEVALPAIFNMASSKLVRIKPNFKLHHFITWRSAR